MLCQIVLIFVVIQTAFGAVIDEGLKDYTQYKLIKVLPKNARNLEEFEKIKIDFDARVDFWNPALDDFRPVLSLIGPDGNDFLVALNSTNIKYEIVSNNFQNVIDWEQQENQRMAAFSTKAFDYNTVYHTYEEILAELKSVGTGNPKATYQSIGKTYEGREIPSLVITNSGGSKKTIIFECGIHSREWITTSSCLWMTNELLNNAALNSYLDKYEFIIAPSVNSDGYAYTWKSGGRTWRKTRQPNSGSTCVGADPNRNWDANFLGSGSSSNPCSETYRGARAFSEPCTQAFSALITKKKSTLAAYFAIHSYSQLWMYPYGYSNAQVPNKSQLDQLSAAALSAIKAVNGLTFKAGPIASTIYVASGSSIDWAYDSCGAKVSFALELRDTGYYGFVMPASHILPAAKETWAGIKAVIDKL